MKILALIQARLGSSRLPKKVLREINGRPLLGYLFERLKFSKKIDGIVVATTENPEDLEIVRFSEKCGLSTFSGSEQDVLDRAYQAAKREKADILIRITADSPLIDPYKVDELIDLFLKNQDNYDYVAFGKSYPEGQNAEVFSFVNLEKAWKEAKLPSQREHFTSFIWNQPDRFKIFRLESKSDYSKFRWTVDEEADFKVVESIIRGLYREGGCFTMEDIISYLVKHPNLLKLNSKIVRDEGYLLSLKKDQ